VHGSDRATRLAGRSEVSASKINAAIGRNSAGLERVTDQELKVQPLALEAQDWSQDLSEAVLVRIRTEMAKKGHPL
jgi:hypothetical protein